MKNLIMRAIQELSEKARSVGYRDIAERLDDIWAEELDNETFGAGNHQYEEEASDGTGLFT